MTNDAADLADRTRAALADAIDRQMASLGLAAIEALAPMPGEAILDIGCGAGATLLQLAERVGSGGTVVGVDVGRHVLQMARARTGRLPHVDCILGDAATVDLPPGSFDALYSRFGTMFFTDPVAAFTRLRGLLKADGRMAFACWRPMQENALDTVPAVAAGLPIPAGAPAFSFAEANTIRDVLLAAGFDRIGIRPFDAPVCCGTVEQTLPVLLQAARWESCCARTPTCEASPSRASAKPCATTSSTVRYN